MKQEENNSNQDLYLLKQNKIEIQGKTINFVTIFLFLLTFLILINYRIVDLSQLVIFSFDLLTISPLCLLIANRKNYNKHTFFFFLIIIILSLIFFINISIGTPYNYIMGIVVFCFYLFWYLIIGIPILFFSQKNKNSFVAFLDIFKTRLSLIVFSVCFFLYLFKDFLINK